MNVTESLLDGDVVVGKLLPLPLMVFVIGLSLGLLLAIFTQRKKEPNGHWVMYNLAMKYALSLTT